MKSMVLTLAGAMLMSLVGCQSMPPIHAVAQVDLERFMGDWYVIANIPTFIEKKAFNAFETYRLAEDGSIQTTFTFNNGRFDGPLKTYTPHAIDSRQGVPEESSVFGAGGVRHRQGEKGATHAGRLTVIQFERPHRAHILAISFQSVHPGDHAVSRSRPRANRLRGVNGSFPGGKIGRRESKPNPNKGA